MEQSAGVEEYNGKIGRPPLFKSSGSLFRIETISIDLANAIDNHQESDQCDHFSIRGYVSEMRKKDIGVCFPFSTDDNKKTLEEQKSLLPPLAVVKFKRWSCHNCLRLIGSACCAKEIGKDSNSLPSEFESIGLCSTTQVFNGDTKGASEIACTEVSREKILISSCGYDKEKEDKDSSVTPCAENDAYHQMDPVMKDKASLNPERRADGSDAMKFLGPSFIGHISSNIRNIENNESNYAQIRESGTSNSANNQQRTEITDSHIIPKVSSMSIGRAEITKGKTSASRLLGALSSESGDIYSKNDQHDMTKNRSTKSVPPRAPKLRLLSEILGSDGNAENNLSRTTDSGSDADSDFCNDMTVQTNHMKHSKGKRKVTQDEIGKSKLFKGHAILAKRNCMVVDCDTDESSGTLFQPKKVKNNVSSKKKQRQFQHEGGYPMTVLCPDVKKYNNAPHEGELSKPADPMYSSNEMNLCYKNTTSPSHAERRSNTHKKKKKKNGVMQSVPLPHWSTMPKDSDLCQRKSVSLSLNSYEVARTNEERNIAKATIGAEPFSHLWNSTVRERCHQVKDMFRAGELSVIRKSAPDVGSGKGLLCDLNENIVTQSPVGDMQNAVPFIGNIQHHRDLNMSGIHNSEPKNDDREKGNEDYPMEIVELMAKIQYERRQHESERDFFSQERISKNGEFNSVVGLPRVHANGMLKSYQVEDHSMGKPLSRTTTVKSSDPPVKVNPFYSFSNFNETSLNLNKMEGKISAFAQGNSFFDSHGTQSGRVSHPNYGSIKNGNHQNFQWRSDSNHTKSPQSYAPQKKYVETSSLIPEVSSRGEMAKGIDLDFVNQKCNNFDKLDRDFGSDYFRKSSSKHKGIDLNAPVLGSSDLHSNETIPAMQLLSLMDARMKSNSNSDLLENQKMVSKPFSSRDYHPKGVHKPSFLYDHCSKEPFGRVIGLSSNEARASSSSSYGKVLQRDNSSCECPPLVPTSGPFSVPFQNVGSFIDAWNGIPTRVPSKLKGKKNGPTQISSGNLQKPSQNSNDFNLKHINQRGYRYVNENFFPSQSVSSSEMCFVNRNPADFSTPERGNIYMIGGKDLKLGKKKISLKGKKGSANVDGKKRRRVTVLTATKTQ